MRDIESLYSEADPLIRAFNGFVDKFDLAEIAAPDHICFKCESSEEFERVRAILEPRSVFIYQSYISGRRIAKVRLKWGFQTFLGLISILELSDQKSDGLQATGFDHIEIYPKSVSYEELVEKLTGRGVELQESKRPHHTTHDIELGDKYNLKLTHEPILNKIRREEMV